MHCTYIQAKALWITVAENMYVVIIALLSKKKKQDTVKTNDKKQAKARFWKRLG